MSQITRVNTQVDDEENQAIIDWLTKNRTGHLGPYMYTDTTDDARWEKGHSSPHYYVGKDEKETLALALNDICVSARALIDLGPGGEKSLRAKSLPILERIGAEEYYPVDLSPTFAKDAGSFVLKEHGTGGRPIISNFYESIPLVKDQSLIMLLGLTLGNIETITSHDLLMKRVSNIFSVYRQAVGKKGWFLVSIDANSNGDEIVACYDNPEFGSLVMSCPRRFIDIADFKYGVRWSSDNYQLATGIVSQRDQVVSFDNDIFTVEHGEFFPVLNSYRFPVAFTISAAMASGWTPKKQWSATGRVHYLLFEST